MKSRILILFAGILFLWGVLITRAAVLQVFPNERLAALQNRQFQTVITLQSRRGAIVDSKGRDLALSMKAYSLYADPKIIEKKKLAAKKIAAILGHSVDNVFGKIKDDRRRFVWIQRLMDEEKANQIKKLDIRGLQIVEEFKRVYPNEELLSQTLGFVGMEGQGLEGLELALNQDLQGNKKKVTVRRDARGRPLIADGLMFAENPDGAEVKLTIDSDLQHTLESELKTAIHEFEAENAIGIILDAKTSAILAMSSAPSFDANSANRLKPELRRNRAVTDVFEPGSTMKTFVVAAALKEKLVQPNTKYNTENGKFKVGDRIIREAESKHAWPQLTVSEIIAYSSNIGTTKIAFDLGPENLQKAMRDFGFGEKLGVDLPGEQKGLVHSLPWRPHLLANISFGHGIAVTALQMANAYAAIANGGVLNTPYIVQSIRDYESNETKEFGPKKIRQVISSEDAASLRLMLTGATAPGGTGENARVQGFIVGGKTGTAQKVNPNGRGYLPGGYVSSFAGFIPAVDPKYVIYVVVDHPRKKYSYYGSQVAAPLFSRVAGYAARQAGLAPVVISDKNLIDKDVVKKSFFRANKKVSPQDEKARVENEKHQLELAKNAAESNVVPDLKNLSLREALKRASMQNISIRARGEGLVSEIIPEPGSQVPNSRRVMIILK